MATTKKLKFRGFTKYDGEPVEQHFFASSLAEWRLAEDPATLINHFKRAGYPFVLWFVPVSIKENYQIDFYRPQVEGAILLAQYLAD